MIPVSKLQKYVYLFVFVTENVFFCNKCLWCVNYNKHCNKYNSA